MSLTTENDSYVETQKRKLEAMSAKELGWKPEEYRAWSERFRKMLDGFSPIELKKFVQAQNKKHRRLKTLLFSLNMIEKIVLPKKIKRKLLKTVLHFMENGYC